MVCRLPAVAVSTVWSAKPTMVAGSAKTSGMETISMPLTKAYDALFIAVGVKVSDSVPPVTGGSVNSLMMYAWLSALAVMYTLKLRRSVMPVDVDTEKKKCSAGRPRSQCLSLSSTEKLYAVSLVNTRADM
nr:unnamed protein product [Digitaria exilis]